MMFCGFNVRFSGFGCGNDTSALDKGIGQGGFSVIDCEPLLTSGNRRRGQDETNHAQ
jgi:hypothetical protein